MYYSASVLPLPKTTTTAEALSWPPWPPASGATARSTSDCASFSWMAGGAEEEEEEDEEEEDEEEEEEDGEEEEASSSSSADARCRTTWAITWSSVRRLYKPSLPRTTASSASSMSMCPT